MGPVMPHEVPYLAADLCAKSSGPQKSGPSKAEEIKTATMARPSFSSEPKMATAAVMSSIKLSERIKSLPMREKENLPQTASIATLTRPLDEKASIPSQIFDSAGKAYYRVGKFLGKGGFASCYQVMSEATGKEYAVKIVPKASLVKPKQKNKLLQEIKIHQSLRHEHIVRIYRVFEDDKFVYIIMELCENQTMMELLRHRHRLTDNEARPLLLQLLSAVEYLHASHVIHRDLKLGNLFLKPGPMMKLGDFGLATLVYGDNDRKRTICGTPNYIAPEIIAGGERGHSYEVDIWSFGVIMYTVLIGQPPFQRQEVKEIYEKIKVANFDFPASVEVSLAAKDLINRLLHPNPEQRPKIAEIRTHPYFSNLPTSSSSQLPLDQKSESGLIISIHRAILGILSSRTRTASSSTSSASSGNIVSISNLPVVYLVKWMDFSSKYGIGYLLSNGCPGFHFNDGTSIVLSSSKSNGHYFQPDEGNRRVLVRESFTCPEAKESIRRKLEILEKFQGFLQPGAVAAPSLPSSPSATSLVFVVKYFRTGQATFFRLSNRVLQVNFFDHCKLLFHEEGERIIFINQEKQGIEFLARHGVFDDSSAQVTGKLKYVADVFTSMISGKTDDYK